MPSAVAVTLMCHTDSFWVPFLAFIAHAIHRPKFYGVLPVSTFPFLQWGRAAFCTSNKLSVGPLCMEEQGVVPCRRISLGMWSNQSRAVDGLPL